MGELMIELYSEEMPASTLANSAKGISQLLEQEVKREKLVFKNSVYFYTPTRLVFLLKDLKVNSDLKNEILRGPSVLANISAVSGFAKSLNVKVNELIKKHTPKGEYYFYKKNIKNINKIQIIQNLLELTLKKISWNKSMKWGDYNLKWIRPLKNILVIYENKKLDIKFGHLNSSYSTIINNQIIEKKKRVENIEHYFQIIKENNIEIDQDKRREEILKNSQEIAKKNNLKFKMNNNLLGELVCLVEKPHLFLVTFKNKFLKLPHEVLTTTMIKNQKYFPLYDDKGIITNSFLLFANRPPKDKGKNIIEGNQRVVNARLEDAAFFWKKDLESKFDKNQEALKRLIFHSELGTLSDKVIRLGQISILIAGLLKLSSTDKKDFFLAVKLSKNDLVTQVVREFPNLQGVMGYYYSLNLGFKKSVSLAIKEHYKPQGPFESIPKTKISQLLSLVDKVDTLVGFFLIGSEPTSSKDPYALRRTALGLIRIIIEGKHNFNLSEVITSSVREYKKIANKNNVNLFSEEETKNNLIKFILERYENSIKEKKEIDIILFKILRVNRQCLNLIELNNNIIFLHKFIKKEKTVKFLSSIKRVINIVENTNDKIDKNSKVNKSLLQKKEELDLYNAYLKFHGKADQNYSNNLNYMTLLTEPIDNFFENVQINDKDTNLRRNRLLLLYKIKDEVTQISDFSILIKGQMS